MKNPRTTKTATTQVISRPAWPLAADKKLVESYSIEFSQ